MTGMYTPAHRMQRALSSTAVAATLLLFAVHAGRAQEIAQKTDAPAAISSSLPQVPSALGTGSSPSIASPSVAPPSIASLLATDPIETGAFFNGGFGTGDRNDYSFLSVGGHFGKLIGSPFGPGVLRGQFEMAGDLMPWWQGRTPRFERANCYEPAPKHIVCSALYPTGGAYNGVSITPVTFRWNLLGNPRHASRRILPFIQGAGGLLWTNHKYPPVGPYQLPGKQGASVWNFTPQFGIGVHYFVRPRQSITLQANAVHISSASLGDTNPGVNASVQFTLGYTWWK